MTDIHSPDAGGNEPAEAPATTVEWGNGLPPVVNFNTTTGEPIGASVSCPADADADDHTDCPYCGGTLWALHEDGSIVWLEAAELADYLRFVDSCADSTDHRQTIRRRITRLADSITEGTQK